MEGSPFSGKDQKSTILNNKWFYRLIELVDQRKRQKWWQNKGMNEDTNSIRLTWSPEKNSTMVDVKTIKSADLENDYVVQATIFHIRQGGETR